DRDRPFRPGITVLERHLDRMFMLIRTVAEPVVNLKLDPGRRQQIQLLYRSKLVARHQLAADLARARGEQALRGWGDDILKRNIAAETRTYTAHPAFREIVVSTVCRAQFLMM